MKVTETKLKDCVIIEPEVFGDSRGFFLESYQSEKYSELAGITLPFVQDNHAHSSKGVLRGMHFQKLRPQGKLVRVAKGSVFDVAIDLRKESETFGKWDGLVLSSENHKQFWVPPGFAHGFLVLEDSTDLVYKCTDYYNGEDQVALSWKDPSIDIKWPINPTTLNERDENAPYLDNLQI
tara:strand:- start:98 stop:634 length:537 start_codon:yes stop_codon:yes gene_type:complete